MRAVTSKVEDNNEVEINGSEVETGKGKVDITIRIREKFRAMRLILITGRYVGKMITAKFRAMGAG